MSVGGVPKYSDATLLDAFPYTSFIFIFIYIYTYLYSYSYSCWCWRAGEKACWCRCDANYKLTMGNYKLIVVHNNCKLRLMYFSSN